MEFIELVGLLKEQPTYGKSIGNNCFKIRLAIASKGKGKSGGARIITYLVIKDATVFLLAMFDKSEKENIPDNEINELIRQIP